MATNNGRVKIKVMDIEGTSDDIARVLGLLNPEAAEVALLTDGQLEEEKPKSESEPDATEPAAPPPENGDAGEVTATGSTSTWCGVCSAPKPSSLHAEHLKRQRLWCLVCAAPFASKKHREHKRVKAVGSSQPN